MDAVPHMLYSQVGGMSLLELSRVPPARRAVLCYARIAQHRDLDLWPTVGEFLATAGRSSVLEIIEAMDPNMGDGPTCVGWDELVCQLAFLYATGKL